MIFGVGFLATIGQWFDRFFEEIKLVVADYSIFRDTLDIALLSYIIYKGICIIRETRAIQLVKGIVLMGGLYLVVSLLELTAMGWLLQRVFELGIIAVLVVFQPELRSTLERFGRLRVLRLAPFNNDGGSVWKRPIEVIVSAAEKLSETKTGALIVIERDIKLGDQIRTGVVLDAVVSEELFGNIFFKNSPLHDGAVIMRDGKVYAASCFLPKPKQEEDIDKNLGSRHRAALGISEVSDSVTVIVSEETGGISLAVNGRLIRNLTPQKLQNSLTLYLIPAEKESEKEKRQIFRKGRKHGKKAEKDEI